MTTKTFNRGLAALSALTLATSLTACSSSDGGLTPQSPPPTSSASPQEPDATEDEPSPEPEPTTESPEPEPEPDEGTRANPFPLGTPAGDDDWSVWVENVNFDAWDVIKAENQFNDPPADGSVFVLVSVGVERLSEEPEDPAWDLSFAIVGGDGRTWDQDCGVTPDEAYDVGEMYQDATAVFNYCTEIPEAALEGAVLKVEIGLFDRAEGFFALK